MFIQTEQTPNPATLKFLPGQVVWRPERRIFPSVDAVAGNSPLAERLFDVDGVSGVFFGHDFITITKQDDREWYVLKPSITGRDHGALHGRPAGDDRCRHRGRSDL